LGRLSSVLCLGLLAAWGSAQTFGRFGFREIPESSLYQWDRTGFRVRESRADWLKFLEVSKPWRPVQVSRYEAVYDLPGDRAFCPNQIRISNLVPSFEVYFPKGIFFQTAAVSAPFLTWPEGSAGAKVPVPPSKWVAISYENDQPPILLSFPESKASLTVTGQPGKWKIRSGDDFTGWVRVTAPLGGTPFGASDAQGLGVLANQLASLGPQWHDHMPFCEGVEYKEVPGGVAGIWSFSSEGVPLPKTLLAAPDGGYDIKVQSPYTTVEKPPAGMPSAYLKSSTLKVFFPLAPHFKGRIVTGIPNEVTSSLDPENPPAVFEEAVRNLTATRDKQLVDRSAAIFSDYSVTAPLFNEMLTKASLPYDKNGRNMTVTASHALLNRSFDLSAKPNELFEKCLRSLDWQTWTLYPEPMETRRRSTALLCVAGALGTTAERAQAAMLRAGLCAERALYRSESGPMLEVLADTNNALFTSNSQDPFFAKISQNFQLLSPDPVRVTTDRGYSALSWVSGKDPLQFWMSKNLEILRIQGNKYFDRKPAADGGTWMAIHALPGVVCTVTLKAKGKPGEVLTSTGLPRYTEAIR